MLNRVRSLGLTGSKNTLLFSGLKLKPGAVILSKQGVHPTAVFLDP